MLPHLKKVIIILLISTPFYQAALAQYVIPQPSNDTSYYERFRPKLSITPNISTRFGGVNLYHPGNDVPLRYRTNNAAKLGVDLSYDFITIGGSIGVGHRDPTYKRSEGKTNSLNLETTINSKSLLVDVFYIKHKGHYAILPEAYATDGNPYYVRPDLETRLTGVSGLYMLNGKQYSTRPVFKYDTWQKKSAGSFMVGMDALFSKVLADSSYIPSFMRTAYGQSTVKNVKVTLLGPAIAYGYHFVVSRRWFATAIANVKADAARIKEWDSDGRERSLWRFSPNLNLRGGIGYGNENAQWAFSYVINHIFLKGNNDALKYTFRTEEYRISYTVRVNAGKTVPKVARAIGDVLNYLHLGFLTK